VFLAALDVAVPAGDEQAGQELGHTQTRGQRAHLVGVQLQELPAQALSGRYRHAGRE